MLRRELHHGRPGGAPCLLFIDPFPWHFTFGPRSVADAIRWALEEGWTADDARKAAPVTARWTSLPGHVRHTFTHFHLELEVMAARITSDDAEGVWCSPDRLGDHALPTVMKKIAAHVLKTG